AFKVTFPVVLSPPRMGVGDTVTEAGVEGNKVSVLLALKVPSEAVIFTVVLAATELVPSVKLALCAPAGMSTGLGFTAALSLLRLSVTPVGGATATIYAVPVV